MNCPEYIAFPTNIAWLVRQTGARAFAILTLASSVVAGAVAAPVCGGRFEQSTHPTVFDGGSFDQIQLSSPAVTLLAFTFGAWTPTDANANGGFALRHTNHPGVVASICPLTGSDVPVDTTRWAAYLALASSGLGPNVSARDFADSAEKPEIVEVLGWRTREVLLTAPASEGVAARAEFHLVAVNGTRGVAFTLSGSPAEVEKTLQDFRFLMSRLTTP